MKTIFLLLALCCCLGSQAQVPNKFNYQAVARNGQGQALANANVSVRISILDGSSTASSIYSETRNLTTNQLGLFTMAIGSTGASSVSGNFATIDWSTGSKFIKVELDPLGGSSFVTLGSTELLSVPYALFAVNGKPVATSIPLKGNGSTASPITFIAGTSDKQILVWDSASANWKLGAFTNQFSGKGTKNLITRWTPDGQTFGNSQIFDDSTKVGVNTTTPTARFEVAGHAATDTTLSPDLNGKSRIVAMVRDTVTNAGNNVGLFTSVGNGKRNVGIYSTSTQSKDTAAGYQGLLINNYDNFLKTYGTVEGIYSDVGNAGKGSAIGLENYVNSTDGNAQSRGIFNRVSATGYSTGMYLLSTSQQGSATGILAISDLASGTGNSWAGIFSASGEDVDMKTEGIVASADGYNSVAGSQIGIQADSYSEETPTFSIEEDAMANPAALFTSDGGSGQAVFAQSIGLGSNSLSWYSPVGEAIKAIAESDQNLTNVGVQGIVANGSETNIGVSGVLSGRYYPTGSFNAAVAGTDEEQVETSWAGSFYGRVNIQDGTEGDGKVFTSDATGTGSWQDLVTPDVHLSSIGGSMQSIPNATDVSINSWTGLEETGGANYNPATGEYTVPVTGYYNIQCHVSWATVNTITSAAPSKISILVDNTALKNGYSNGAVAGQFYNDPEVTVLKKLNAGQVVKFNVQQSSGAATNLFLDGSSFSITLTHK